jgi:gluconolactonase
MLGGRTLIRRIRCALCFALSLLPLAAQPARIGSIRRLDPAVDKVVPPNAAIEKVSGNLQFAEGPVWVRNGGYLLFSDIPANAIIKWIPSGQLTLFRKPVFARDFTPGMQIGTNGLTLDREGRLISRTRQSSHLPHRKRWNYRHPGRSLSRQAFQQPE